MNKYAMLNIDNICTGYLTSSSIINQSNCVPISEQDEVLWKKYINGSWSTETFEIKPTKLSKLQFTNRFTFEELITIEIIAETNPSLRIIKMKQTIAEYIDLTDPETQLSIMYLVSLGIISHSRGLEILTP